MSTFNIGDIHHTGAIILDSTENEATGECFALALNAGGVMPFVTWRFQQGEKRSTYAGNYYTSVTEAVDDFNSGRK